MQFKLALALNQSTPLSPALLSLLVYHLLQSSMLCTELEVLQMSLSNYNTNAAKSINKSEITEIVCLVRKARLTQKLSEANICVLLPVLF